MSDDEPGWGWFEPSGTARDRARPVAPHTVDQLAARCFRGADGEHLLAHLRAFTVDRVLPPDASPGLLRYLEGQRHLMSYLMAMVRRGRGGRTQENINLGEHEHDT